MRKAKSLEDAANIVGASFSGSWLGYHSTVYYENFEHPPAGAHFSSEWGLKEMFSSLGSHGRWREHNPDTVKRAMYKMAGDPDLASLSDRSSAVSGVFSKYKQSVISIIESELAVGEDRFLTTKLDEIRALEILSGNDICRIWSPSGPVMTRDMIALGQGTKVPPHTSVKARVEALRLPFELCSRLAELADQLSDHLVRKSRKGQRSTPAGSHIFIGHGRSPLWREVKDFVQDRLRLPWDEFNRVPVAGVTNIARLSEMLDDAAFALIIMTAEDQRIDGELIARMNVVHEVGLFQGRLGFTRAIVLLEEGCAEFSNIQGLGQIRFPRGNIAACFEQVRAVLEREGLLST